MTRIDPFLLARVKIRFSEPRRQLDYARLTRRLRFYGSCLKAAFLLLLAYLVGLGNHYIAEKCYLDEPRLARVIYDSALFYADNLADLKRRLWHDREEDGVSWLHRLSTRSPFLHDLIHHSFLSYVVVFKPTSISLLKDDDSYFLPARVNLCLLHPDVFELKSSHLGFFISQLVLVNLMTLSLILFDRHQTERNSFRIVGDLMIYAHFYAGGFIIGLPCLLVLTNRRLRSLKFFAVCLFLAIFSHFWKYFFIFM